MRPDLEVAGIAWQNKTLLCDLLFRAASETMMTIAADPRHLGARIGISAVLHTWRSAMAHHLHVHMIVPGGGIAHDGTRHELCGLEFARVKFTMLAYLERVDNRANRRVATV